MVVVLLSVSLHVLFLIGFGSKTIFPKRIAPFLFTAQEVGESQAEMAEGPPTEPESNPPSPPEELAPPSVQPETSALDEPLVMTETAIPRANPVPVSTAPPTSLASGPATTRSGNPAARPSFRPSSTPPAFFGIPMKAQEARVVIILDTSNTMFERKRDGQTFFFDFSVVKREVENLIGGLSEDSFFNLVIYESGSQAYAGQMVLADENAKKHAAEWIGALDEDPSMTIAKRPGPTENKLLEGRGTRLDTALKQTVGFKPSVVFILTDGEVQRVEEGVFRWLGELRKLKPAPEVNVLQYLTEKTKAEETEILRRIASRGGGKFKTVEAKMLAPGSRGGP